MHYENYRPFKIAFLQKLIDRLMLPTFIASRAPNVLVEPFDVLMSPSGMGCVIYKRLRRQGNGTLTVSHIFGLSFFDHLANLRERYAGNLKLSWFYRLVSAPLTLHWEQEAARFADLNIVMNNRDLDFIRRSHVTEQPVIKIPGVVIDPILRGSRKETSPKRRPNSLMWFGSWTPRKGKFALPSAFDLILDEAPDTTLTIGGTHLSEQTVKGAFSERAKQNIVVLPKISVEEQIECFNTHSVFLFPSLSEGFGLALVEAMALGLAVITTDTGVGGDSLEHGLNALIVPVGSSLHLARATIRLLKDDGLREKISENGRLLAQEFSEESMVTGFERALSDALHSKHRKATC